MIERVLKGAGIGGGGGALTGAAVGSLFGRAAVFAGLIPGVGAPAAVLLGIAGGIAGMVGGAMVGAVAGERERVVQDLIRYPIEFWVGSQILGHWDDADSAADAYDSTAASHVTDGRYQCNVIGRQPVIKYVYELGNAEAFRNWAKSVLA